MAINDFWNENNKAITKSMDEIFFKYENKYDNDICDDIINFVSIVFDKPLNDIESFYEYFFQIDDICYDYSVKKLWEGTYRILWTDSKTRNELMADFSNESIKVYAFKRYEELIRFFRFFQSYYDAKAKLIIHKDNEWFKQFYENKKFVNMMERGSSIIRNLYKKQEELQKEIDLGMRIFFTLTHEGPINGIYLKEKYQKSINFKEISNLVKQYKDSFNSYDSKIKLYLNKMEEINRLSSLKEKVREDSEKFNNIMAQNITGNNNLNFYFDFVERIIFSEKTLTTRKKKPRFNEGDIIFLTYTKDVEKETKEIIATVQVLSIRKKGLNEITDSEIHQEGFYTRDDYLTKIKEIYGDLDEIYLIEWKLIDFYSCFS